MIGRLIVDVFRRTWWLHAIGVAQLAALWTLPALMPISGDGILAPLSMVMAFGLGPLIALFSLHRQEVLLRPVSARDLWRATWLYSTLAVPLLLAAAKAAPVMLLAPISRAPLSDTLAALLLSTAYEAVYCGGLLIFLAFALRVSRRDGVPGLWRTACLGAFFSGLALAFVLRDYLATDWRALTPASSAALAIGAFVAVVSLLLAAPSAARPGRSIARRQAGPTAAAPTGLVASLSGFQIAGWTYGGLLCVGVVAMVVWFFLLTKLSPSAARPTPLSLAVPIAAFHPAFFLLRRLRTMPFAPWQLTMLLMAGPVINTAAICGAALIAGLTTGGRGFAEVTPALAVLTVGGGAFVSALQIRLQPGLGPVSLFTVVPLFVISGRIGETIGRGTTGTVLIVGAALFAVAVVLHHRNITRHNKSFRPMAQGGWLKARGSRLGA